MTEEENTSNEEQQYTIKDIDKLSLLDDTIVDLEDKQIDASSEIDGITLLKHGAVAETKPLNDNFIYINARTDNVVNSLSKYADDIAEYQETTEEKVDNCLEQCSDSIANVSYHKFRHENYIPLTGDSETNRFLTHNVISKILVINSMGSGGFYSCYSSDHDYVSTKYYYKSQKHKQQNMPFEAETIGRINLVYSVASSAGKIRISLSDLSPYPWQEYEDTNNYFTYKVMFSDIDETSYYNATELENTKPSYSNTQYAQDLTYSDWSNSEHPGVILLSFAKNTTAPTNHRCTVTYTAKKFFPIGLKEIEEDDAP